jgi:peroxiredoxin
MKNRILVFLLILCPFVYSFSQKNVHITGNFKNHDTYSKVYFIQVTSDTRLDSAVIGKNGDFLLNTSITETDYYKLFLNEDQYILLILQPGEKVNVTADLDDIYNPSIKGSQQSELLYKILHQNASLDKLVEDYKAKVDKDKKEALKKMIKENPSYMAYLFFVDQLDMKEENGILSKLDSALMKKYPGNALVNDFNARFEESEFLKPGTKGPELTLPDVNGKMISTSSFKGKYFLMDFWASWSKPSRIENASLVKVYDKFKSKGLEILGISLDSVREDWVSSIDKDKLSWPQVSDLKFWESKAVLNYKFASVPFMVLFDKDGNVALKCFHVSELEGKLDELLK